MKKFYYLIILLFLNLGNILNAKFGKGLLLDGCNNYLEVSASSQLLKGRNGITIEAWILPNCDDENRVIVSKQWCNNQYGYYLSVFEGRLFWSISSNGLCVLTSNYQTENVIIPANIFTHIVIVHDVNSIKLYVNGSLASGQYFTGSFIPIYPSDEPIRIGAYKNIAGTFGNFFSGIIDELRFYDAPLTSEQISQNFNTRLTGSEANLVLYYDMEDNTGTGQNLRIDNKRAGLNQHFAVAKGFMGKRPILVNSDEYINQNLVLEDEIVICINTDISLNLDAYKEIRWSNGQSSQTINVVREGLYSVTVETELCRFLYDEINVVSSIAPESERGIYIPNIFWPQSTSGNDKWRIHIPECYQIEMVKIYDRWGNLVSFLNNPQAIEWDGIYKGTTLEQGVYTYIIHFSDDKNERNILSGDVTLIR